MTDTTFNGWSSWNAWNVALWFGNDETLYKMMTDAIKQNPDLSVAAAKLQSLVGYDTPDGAVYDYLSVREAIADDHGDYWDA